MSVTVVRDKGVTVVTVTSDSKNIYPPLCQILKGLCYSPMCCSVNKGTMQTSVTAALGTIQIMVGLFSIGLGPGRTPLHPDDFTYLGAAYWLGGVSIVAGIAAVLAGQYPSVCLVGLAVFTNIIGTLFSIVGIVLYSLDLASSSNADVCRQGWYNSDKTDDNCEFVMYFFRRLLTGMDITMIILAVLQLCVSISFAVLGIKAMINRKKEEQDDKDVEIRQPLLKEVLMTSPSA